MALINMKHLQHVCGGTGDWSYGRNAPPPPPHSARWRREPLGRCWQGGHECMCMRVGMCQFAPVHVAVPCICVCTCAQVGTRAFADTLCVRTHTQAPVQAPEPLEQPHACSQMHAQALVCMRAHTHTHVHSCTYRQVHVYTHMYLCTHEHVYTRLPPVLAYVYTCTCVQTGTHTPPGMYTNKQCMYADSHACAMDTHEHTWYMQVCRHIYTDSVCTHIWRAHAGTLTNPRLQT